MAHNPAARTGKRSAVTIADEQVLCLDLRRKGYTVREIADETGIARSTVQLRLDDALAELVLPAADEVRQLELARLDRWQRRLEALFDDPERDVCKVVTTALRVQERRAKLLGLDAPTRAQVDATVTEVTQEDIALRELLAEAQARSAADEAVIRRDEL